MCFCGVSPCWDPILITSFGGTRSVSGLSFPDSSSSLTGALRTGATESSRERGSKLLRILSGTSREGSPYGSGSSSFSVAIPLVVSEIRSFPWLRCSCGQEEGRSFWSGRGRDGGSEETGTDSCSSAIVNIILGKTPFVDRSPRFCCSSHVQTRESP